MFDCGGKSIPSFSCSGVTWSATACAASMNIVGRALCVRGVDGHADRGEDVEVVGLRRQKRLAAEVDRWELHAAGIDRLALGPFISLLGQAFVVLDRVGEGKDDWPPAVARHPLGRLARAYAAQCSGGKRVTADANQDRRLEIFIGRDRA